MTKVNFLGSCREVGRSAVLLESNQGDKLLLDYGTRFKEEERLPYKTDLSNLKGIVPSHCHVDHTGAIPSLYTTKEYPLFTNPVTLRIMEILLRDTLKVSSYPYPFGVEEIKKMVKNAYFLNNGVRQKIADDFYITFLDAGHIPGSVSVLVDVDDKKILYTGDMNTQETNLVHSADYSKIPEIDSLIIESTYALRDHPIRSELEKEFMENVFKTTEVGGKVLIPAFSVARSQEALMILDKYNYDGNIFLDGMAKLVSKIYTSYPDALKNAKRFRNSLKGVRFITKRHREKQAKKSDGVIVSPSGMLKGGSVLKYITGVLRDPASAIYLIGYQVEGTPGRKLIETGTFEYKEERRNRGTVYDMNVKAECDVGSFDFSSHADGKHLHEFVDNLNFNNGAKSIFCIHGDNKSTTTFSSDLAKKSYLSVAPEIGETYTI